MVRIKPEQFRDAFKEGVRKAEPGLSRCWQAGRVRSYTAAIRGILPDVARTLGLQLFNKDYYSLDAILYESKDEKNFAPSSTYAHQISVAIELENKLRGSQVEVNKLQLFNTPLKVLVTYASDHQQQEWLTMYSEMIKRADVFGDFSSHRRQLVIFGSCVDATLDWRFYVYQRERFAELPQN